MAVDVKYPSLTLSVSQNMNLTWKNISYTVERKRNDNGLMTFLGLRQKERVQLLHGVNGTVNAGILMAVMGPSGSGKTVLLATISRRVKGETTGEVLLNGKAIDTKSMIRISGFVPQEDLAVESLTVQEHMEFTACMKMDHNVRSDHRKQRIAILLTELGLVKCSNSKLLSLSGGERKRVSLAVQLLTEPSILFCDEPTTGLDSFAAMSVVSTLRNVATRGRIVICSLHQPASGILDAFHEILLISTGRVAFQGAAAHATEFFDSLGFRCPPTFNSAEFYVSQLSVTGGQGESNYKKIHRICSEFKKSKYGQNVERVIENACTNKSQAEVIPSIFSMDSGSPTEIKKIRALTQVEWLVWRSYVQCKRSFSSSLLKFVLYMFIGVLLCTPYVNVAETLNQRAIQSIQGLLYLVVIETIFNFNYSVFYTFPQELPLLLRDIASDLYSPTCYYISKIIVLLPGTVLQPFIFCALVFIVTGLNGGFSGFIYFMIPIVFAATAASAFGCLMSASFRSFNTASLLSVPIDFVTLIFCGIYLQLGNLSPGIGWIKYLSQFYYGLEAVSLSQWLQVEHIDCSVDPEVPCISTGLGVLEKYGYQSNHYYIDLFGLVVVFALSHFGGFLAIRHRSRQEATY